jgi:hypothetical protein
MCLNLAARLSNAYPKPRIVVAQDVTCDQRPAEAGPVERSTSQNPPRRVEKVTLGFSKWELV